MKSAPDPWPTARATRPGLRRRGARGVVALALIALLGSCGGGAVQAGGAPTPTLVLLAVDSLPARSLGVLGSEFPTPHLDALLRESQVHTRCLAPSPWSARNLRAALRGADVGPDGPPPLSAALAGHGWRSVLVAGHDCVGEDRALCASFEVVLDPGAGKAAGAPASAVVEAGLEALDSLGTSTAMLVLHLADPRPPHHRYPGLVPEADAPYEGPVRAGLDHPELVRIAPRLEDLDRERLRALHASEVAAVDAAVGRLIEGLRARGLWDSAIVALVGTRGVALGEGGVVGLLPSLDVPQVHVPLALRIPGGARGLVDLPTRLEDLRPTLEDHLGLPPRQDLQGRSMLPGARAAERILVLTSDRARPLTAAYGVTVDGEGVAILQDDESGDRRFVPWPASGSAADAGNRPDGAEDSSTGESEAAGAALEILASRAGLFDALDAAQRGPRESAEAPR